MSPSISKVILPFTVLRRLDCVLDPTKPAVLAELKLREKAGLNPEPFLLKKSGQLFYNTSPLDLKKLMGDQDHIGENLRSYVQAFSPAVRDIFVHFDFHAQIDRLAKSGLLYLVTEKFANVDLHPDAVSNAQMGALPHAPDAWIDHEKTRIGYEIPFNRHFYVFKPPRPLNEIDAELEGATDRILQMIGGLTH